MRRASVATGGVLSILSVCLYSCLSHPECESHLFCVTLYCHLWPVWLYHIFPHDLMTRFSGEKLLNVECVCFDFLCSFVCKFVSLWEELSEVWSQIHNDIHVKCRLFLSDFNETWNFSTNLRKILKYQISWKSYSGSGVVSCGRTWRS